MLIAPPLLMPAADAVKRIVPPLGLAALAAPLKNDYDVRILDCVIEGFDNSAAYREGIVRVGLEDEEIRKRIAAFAPDIAGISVGVTDLYPTAHELLPVVKDAAPDAVTVFGGVYATTQTEHALSNPLLDYCLAGEADLTFPRLIEAIEKGNDPALPPGAACVRDGRVMSVPGRSFIRDLDSLPIPARDLLRMDLYTNVPKSFRFGPRRKPHTTIITSRGCPGHCIFCNAHHMMGRRFRAHSPGRVLDEIQLLAADFGIRELAFLDDNLTLNRRRAEAIFDGMAERGFDMLWTTPNGLALYALDDSLIGKMKAAGCYSACLAFESGCQDVLDNIIRKPLKLARTKEFVRRFKDLGIETIGMFVIGFPGETKEQIQRTIRFAEDIDCDYVSFSIATPYPGSELFDICEREGCFVEDFSLDHLVFGFGRGHIETPDFSPEDLYRFRKEQWERINFRLDPARHAKIEEWLKR